MPRFNPLTLPSLAERVWRRTVRIRFGDCDPSGIVYTPEYLNIFNGIIEDWYGEALRMRYHLLIGERRIGLGYAHVSADFAQPSAMGDELSVAVVIKNIGRSSLTLAVHAFKHEMECIRANFVTVTTSLVDHSVLPIPADLRAALEAYQQHCEPTETHENRLSAG